jgi:NAD(P)-dependent dehydrogenase (short-subunit alcohol dehydrogenase family)
MTGALDGKVCVVSGALGLIGGELAPALVAEGGLVALTDLDHYACVDRAASLGAGALGLGADVTRPESVAALRDAVLAWRGRIDALVLCAAIDDRFTPGEGGGRFEDYPIEQWRRSLDVNVTGTFVCAQLLGREMAARGGGSIVTVASTYGLVGPDQSLYRRPDRAQAFFKSPAYPTGKAAVIGFTRYLAAYWGPAGVRVNALAPAFVHTALTDRLLGSPYRARVEAQAALGRVGEQHELAPGGVANGQEPWFVESYARRTPLGRMASARDLIGAVLFLASDASAYVTGATLVVDGGWTAW